jgi:hypothetical protein
MIFTYLLMVFSASVFCWSMADICCILRNFGRDGGFPTSGVNCPRRGLPPFDCGSAFARPEIEGGAFSLIP